MSRSKRHRVGSLDLPQIPRKSRGNIRKINFRKCVAMFSVSVVVYLYQNKKSLKLLINKLFIIFMLENLLTVVNCICLLGAVIRLC